jgi:hypothetical protein
MAFPWSTRAGGSHAEDAEAETADGAEGCNSCEGRAGGVRALG